MLKLKTFLKNNIIPILFLIIVLLMTVGYALYGQTLNLNGNVTLEKVGRIEITSANIVRDGCSNLTSYNEPTYDGMRIEFRINSRSQSFSATYLITVTNNSNIAYTYTGFPVNATIEGYDYVPNVTSTITHADSGEELQTGETINSGESMTLRLKLDFSLDQGGRDLTVVVNGSVSASQDNSGNLIPSITPLTGDLRGEGTLAEFDLSVINTFKYNRTFSLSSSNENIILVDANGSQMDHFSITANSTQNYKIYLKVKPGSIFLTDQTETNIILSSADMDNIEVGKITLNVDVDIDATDHEKPEVGNVTVKISENNPVDGEANVSWSRIDSGGSPIVNYYIRLYNADNGNLAGNYETGNAVTSYTISGLSAGNYYAVVYGEDEAGNNGAEDVGTATTNNGYASKSVNTYLKWIYNVDTSGLSRLSSNGASTALIYSTYETTLSLTANNTALPGSITITMGGQTLSAGTDYTYDSSSGKIVINRVTGDISISGSAESNQCLVEGTKILLADGTTKKIEDIKYNDLLMVYDHENGGFTYEYPIWIENGKSADNYQKITFSDGSVLKTFGTHGIFSADLNKYVNVLNREEFHVGSRIIRFNKDGSRKVVTVTKIENINDDIKYYYIASTRYYNVISEGYLTNNGFEFTSFLYSFDDDLTWGKERDYYLAQNDFFKYEDWKNVFPEYLFKGLRMGEAKYIYNHGLLDIPSVISKLDISNTKEVMKDKDNDIVWMVTTSDDVVTGSNINNYLKKYKSIYVLPEPVKKDGFIGWLNTADNKMYKPGDKVEVLYGIHFVAQYK